MKKIQLFIAGVLVVAFGAFALAPAAFAYDPLADACKGVTDNAVCNNKDENADDLIKTLVNTLLFIVGTLSVIMIIVGGILYVTSTGDAGKVSKAKNTITYAIVGLVVSFVAFAIVNWVMTLF